MSGFLSVVLAVLKLNLLFETKFTYGGGILVLVEGHAAIPGVSGNNAV
jgi:hypothetical protein